MLKRSSVTPTELLYFVHLKNEKGILFIEKEWGIALSFMSKMEEEDDEREHGEKQKLKDMPRSL